MKINRKKQQGATLVTWLIVAGFAFLTASAVVKIAPYYVEFSGVQKMMKGIASEPGIQKANKRQVNAKIEKYLNLNNLRALEEAYYGAKAHLKKDQRKNVRGKSPFTITKMKKGKNRRKLSVHYDVKPHWLANISFLVDFKHSVMLGYPDEKVEEEVAKKPKSKIKLR